MLRFFSFLLFLVWFSNNNIAAQDDPCAALQPGDIMIYAFNSDDPETITMVSFVDLPVGLKIMITDNAWTGTEFLTNEGTFALTLTSPVSKGGSLGYGQNPEDVPFATDWLNVEDDNLKGQFALADTGDSIIVYCEMMTNTATNGTDSSNINHLSALSYTTGGFTDPGLTPEDYGTRNTALPAPLQDVGSLALRHLDNYNYKGQTTGTKEEIQGWLADGENNWIGTYNPDTGAPPIQSFTILDESAAAQGNNNAGGSTTSSTSSASTIFTTSMMMMMILGAALIISLIM